MQALIIDALVKAGLTAYVGGMGTMVGFLVVENAKDFVSYSESKMLLEKMSYWWVRVSGGLTCLFIFINLVKPFFG